MHNARWSNAPWLALLLLIILLWIGRAFLPGQLLLPLDLVSQLWPPWQQPTTAVAVHNPLLSDVVDYIYPVKTFVADSLKAGNLPLWNPYVLGGYPLTYNTQAGLWYPLSLFYYLLPAPTAVDLTIFTQLALGGFFMFAYLRQLRLHPAAALLGSLLFLFNGMMVAWLEWQVVHAGVIWLPLCLYAIERMRPHLQHGRLPAKPIILAAAAFALPWLGGHWNWALYSSLTAVVYLVWRLAQVAKQQKRYRPLWATAVAVPLLGASLSALQLIPAIVYLAQSHRQPFTLAESLALGLKNRAIVALMPNFFGNPIHHDWWGPTNYNETAVYLGILPLLLAAILLLLRRDGLTFFYTGLASIAWLTTLGFLYPILWLLPVFDGLWPSRAMPVALFCTAVLAALTLDHLLRHPIPRYQIARYLSVPTAVCLLLLAAYTATYRPDLNNLRPDLLWFGLMLLAAWALLLARPWLPPLPFALLTITLVSADLLWAGYAYNTIGQLADLYPETDTSRFLQNDPEPYRIASLPEGVAYPPNTALQARIPAISGYEPGILQTWVDYFSAVEGQTAIYFERELMPWHNLDSPLLDAVNLKYFVTIDDWYADAPTPGPAADQGQTWQPLPPTAVTQPLSMPIAGLQRIDLFLQTAVDTSGTVTLRIFNADGSQPLAHAEWPVQPNHQGPVPFYFSPFPSQWGLDFLFSVEFVGTGPLLIGQTADGLAYHTYFLDRPNLAHEAGKTRIYLNPGYFPRAYLVSQALLATDASDALAQLLANQHRLDDLVLLEAPSLPHQSPTAVNGTAVITSQTLNQLTIHTTSDAPAYLVLADSYYRGWQATLNGQVTDLYRANSVVRAVAVPAGSHEVRFTFRPLDFYIGASLTAVALLACLTFLIGSWRRSHAHES